MRATVTVEGRLASLTDRALGRREVAELEGAMGAPLDRAASQLAVAIGLRELWPVPEWAAWVMASGSNPDAVGAGTAAALVESYEALAADGYEPNWAERPAYEACVARAGREGRRAWRRRTARSRPWWRSLSRPRPRS